jgi:hypothetical protein
VQIVDSSPVFSGVNQINGGSSNGNQESVGLLVDGDSAPAEPLVGDGTNAITITGGGPGMVSPSVSTGIRITGEFAGGTYRRVNVTGRLGNVGDLGDSIGVRVENDARPVFRGNGSDYIWSGDFSPYAVGFDANGILGPGFEITGYRISGTRTVFATTLSCGLRLSDVAEGLVARNIIYGGYGNANNVSGIYIYTDAVNSGPGLQIYNNAIMASHQTGGQAAIRVFINTGGHTISPRIWGNTLYGGPANEALHIEVSPPGSSARLDIRNNLAFSNTNAAIYESPSGGGDPSPAIVRHNALFSSGAGHYYDRATASYYSTVIDLNDETRITQGAADSANGNLPEDWRSFLAGYAPNGNSMPTSWAQFDAFDWRLLPATPVEAAADDLIPLALDAADATELGLDLYGAARPAAPWAIGAAQP